MAIKPGDAEELPHHARDVEKSITELASVPVCRGDVLSLGHIDHALTAKMHLVNNVCLLLNDLRIRTILTNAGN